MCLSKQQDGTLSGKVAQKSEAELQGSVLYSGEVAPLLAESQTPRSWGAVYHTEAAHSGADLSRGAEG